MSEPKRGRGRPKKVVPPNDGNKPDLPPQAWACLEVEFSHGWIGEATLGQIKRKTGLSRESIRRWRTKPLYTRGFAWLVATWWQEQEDREDAERENAEFELAKEVDARVRARMPQWIADRWAGAVRSMADGEIYTDPAAYAAHLIEAGFVPADLQNEIREELAGEAERIRLSA
jgi:hypothetical protein